MTRFLDAALRFGFGVLLACAGLSAPAASSAPADAPRAPEVRGEAAAAVFSSPSATAIQALARAGFIRLDGRRAAPQAAVPAVRLAPASLSSVLVAAAPAAARRPGAAPGVLSRGPPASV